MRREGCQVLKKELFVHKVGPQASSRVAYTFKFGAGTPKQQAEINL